MQYNTFIFVWRTTILPFNLDLFLYKLFQKDVIIFNCGDDVRYRPIQYKIESKFINIDSYWDGRLDYDPYYKSNLTFLKAFMAQRIQEITKSKVISMRNMATFQKLNKYYFTFPTQKKLESPKIASDIPLIIHAPTDREIKGTRYVIEAIERLRSEGINFEFELIENKSNEYVLSRLIDADIVIDQPGTWIGKLSSEGLACSCVVFTGINNKLEGYPNEPPVIQFNKNSEELTNNLRKIIKDKQLRQSIMTQSYYYWKENYSYEAFVKFFRNVLSGTADTFAPLPNHKKLLTEFSLNRFQRMIVKIFY